MHKYKTRGTCSSAIEYEIQDGVITECRIIGGCMGNTKGITALVKGMKVEDVIARLKGTPCGFRGTSCPDQLARALEAHISK